MPISDVNKRGSFSDFALKSKGSHFSIGSFDILIFCNILHLEMILEICFENGSFFFHKVLNKSLVKININTISK